MSFDGVTPLRGSAPTRRFELLKAGRHRDKEGIPMMLTGLKDPAAEVRQAAAWALGRVADPTTIPGLLPALRDEQFEVRSLVGWALVYIGAPAVEPLLEIYRHSTAHEARQMAWLALERIWKVVPGLHQVELEGPMPTRTAFTEGGAHRGPAGRAHRADANFFGYACHDLRNTAAAVSGNAGLLDTLSQEDPSREETIQDIANASRWLEMLSGAILDSVADRGGQLDLNIEQTTIWALIDNLVPLARIYARPHGVKVEVDCSPQCSAGLRVDTARLSRALINLIGNAVKASPPNGRITLTGEEFSPHFVRLSVLDEGPGLNAAQMDELSFDDEIKAADDEQVQRGWSLGLHVVRQMVRAHGGRLIARNRPEGGAAFHIDLPRGE